MGGAGTPAVHLGVVTQEARDLLRAGGDFLGFGPVLDAQAYADLAKPGTTATPFTYRAVAPDLFNSILGAVMHSGDPSRHTDHPSQRAER